MGAGTGGTSPVFNSTAGVTDSLARDQLARVALSTGTATTDELDQAVADLEAEVVSLKGQDTGEVGQVPVAQQADLAGRKEGQRLGVHGARAGPGGIGLVAVGLFAG